MTEPGIYLVNSTGEMNALATESGDGDRELLREALEKETDLVDNRPSAGNQFKWESAWGEFNAALHGTIDAQKFLEAHGDGCEERLKVVQELRDEFNEIAEKHDVETFGECWGGSDE